MAEQERLDAIILKIAAYALKDKRENCGRFGHVSDSTILVLNGCSDGSHGVSSYLLPYVSTTRIEYYVSLIIDISANLDRTICTHDLKNKEVGSSYYWKH
jgi:hypothetical protein